MRNLIHKMCKYVEEHLKFTLFLFMALSIFGTAFSIDKSFAISKLSAEVNSLRLEKEELESTIREFKLNEIQLKSESRKLSEKYLEDRRGILLKQEELINKKKGEIIH